AVQVAGGELDLAGVEPRADADVLTREGIDHRSGAADPARRAGEEDLETVTGGPDLAAAETLDLCPQSIVVLEEHRVPLLISNQLERRRGSDDIGHEDPPE